MASKWKSITGLINKAYDKWAHEYHYHIPLPILKSHIKKFFHESANIAKYDQRFYNPNNVEEYNQWLTFQSYRKDVQSIDLTLIGKHHPKEQYEYPYVCIQNLDLSQINTEYVGIMDTDVHLYPEIYAYLQEIFGNDVMYFDHDIFDENERSYPKCKPDFAYDTLHSYNYIGPLWIVRKQLLKQFEGSWNPYQWLLELSNQNLKFHHVSKIVYGAPKDYKEEINSSTVSSNGDEPLVSILIPTKDHVQDLKRCINSILDKSTYVNYEIIVIDNNSNQPETFTYFNEIQKNHSNIKVLQLPVPFNFSHLNNEGRKVAKGDYILMLNNDVEVITTNWLEQMVDYCRLEGVGSVGAKLFYEDGTLQHAGVIVGKGGTAAHRYYRCEADVQDYAYTLQLPNNVLCNTAACLMVKASAWDAVGGMDEELSVQYNDVDFCIRLYEHGYRNIFLPSVELFHYESKSRGLDKDPEGVKRAMQERELFAKKWEKYIDHDPFYNDNFDKNYDYQLKVGTGSN